jgi:pimeloyl-ACP methyl ester carboxylesterase
MANDDEHNLVNRRSFLATASTALVGSSLLAAGWPNPAGASLLAPSLANPAVPALGPLGPGMGEFKTGVVQANGLEFHYFEAGQGPLALCLHGWPDSPYTYRHLLPELARAGYHAVAPFMRGYHPTAIPAKLTDTNDLAADVVALHAALGGDGNAVLIAHDWGAVSAWGGAARGPASWRRCVIMNVPPLAIDAQIMFSYPQVKREFYWWFHQMKVSDQVVPLNNFSYIDGIWADWSPGYDAREDLPHAKDCMRPPGHLQATLGYYRTFFDPDKFGTPQAAAEQAATWGRPLTQRCLYMHGSQDGLFPLDTQTLSEVHAFVGPGSEVRMVDGVGHFMLVEKPQVVNANILGFLSS